MLGFHEIMTLVWKFVRFYAFLVKYADTVPEAH